MSDTQSPKDALGNASRDEIMSALFAGLVMASQVGETAALRLHATEFLLLLGTAIVLLVERPAGIGVLALQQTQLLNNR